MAKSKRRKQKQQKRADQPPGAPAPAAAEPQDGEDGDGDDATDDAAPDSTSTTATTTTPTTETSPTTTTITTTTPDPTPSPSPSPSPSPTPIPTPVAAADASPLERARAAIASFLDTVLPRRRTLADSLDALEFDDLYLKLLIVFVVCAVYLNATFKIVRTDSFPGFAVESGVPFLFDDAPVITRNHLLQSFSYEEPKPDGTTVTHYTLVELFKAHPTRFLTNLTFWINYRLAGTQSYQPYGPTWPYHVVSVGFHAANALLLYALIASLLGPPIDTGSKKEKEKTKRRAQAPPARAIDVPPELARWVALGAALLFAVHPVQTMAVSYIAQRYALLGATSFLGALVCFVKLRRRIEAGIAWTDIHLFRSLWILGALLACCAACGLTKENTFVLPVVFVAIEFLFFRRPPWYPVLIVIGLSLFSVLVLVLLRLLMTGTHDFWPDESPTSLSRTVQYQGPEADLPWGFVMFPIDRIGEALAAAKDGERVSGRWFYFFTEWDVLLKYLQLWFWPFGFTVEHNQPLLDPWYGVAGHDEIMATAGQVRRELARALCAHGLIFALAALWWRRGLRLAPFCVLWFYATLAIESSIVPILDPMVEHRLYLPSCGLAALVAVVVARLAHGLYQRVASSPNAELSPEAPREVRGANAIVVGFAALLVGLGFGTVMRNRVWASETEIWEDTIAKRPDCARAYSSLGMELLYKGDWLEAIGPIETALQLGPYHVEGWNNIGKAYLELGQARPMMPRDSSRQLAENPLLDWAADALIRGIEVDKFAPSPSTHLCWNNLGLIFLKRAEDLGRLPAEKEARVKKQLELEAEAEKCIERSVKLNPYYDTGWINLGTARVRQADRLPNGDPKKIELGKKAAEALRNADSLFKETQLTPVAIANYFLALCAAGEHREAMRVGVSLVRSTPAAGALSLRLMDEVRDFVRQAKKPIEGDDLALVLRSCELLRAYAAKASFANAIEVSNTLVDVDLALGRADDAAKDKKELEHLEAIAPKH